jgi:hypothetical protein
VGVAQVALAVGAVRRQVKSRGSGVLMMSMLLGCDCHDVAETGCCMATGEAAAVLATHSYALHDPSATLRGPATLCETQ